METRRADPADFAHEFVWDMSTFRGWPERQEWHGAEGMDAFTDEWLGAWADWSVEINRIQEGEPGQVVVELTQRGADQTAGVPVEMRFAQLWTLNEDGLNTRMRMYADVDEARAEAGISTA